MKTLSGLVCIRNGDILDYSWRECIQSLLPVCDTVTICIGSGNEDTTEELVRSWEHDEHKLRICVYSWPNPVGDPDFWVKWMNYGRQHCPSDYIFQLDADEVLSEWSYPEVEQMKNKGGRFTVRMNRLNFWRDAKHLIPPGVCISHIVNRMGPRDCWIPSDGAHPMGAEWSSIGVDSGIEIFHYGFLRNRKAFFRKAKEIENYFFGTYDRRFQDVEYKDGNWMERIEHVDWIHSLIPFEGHHPFVIHNWLRDRFYIP